LPEISANCRGVLRLLQWDNRQRYHPNIAHSIRLNTMAKTHGHGDEYRRPPPGSIISTGWPGRQSLDIQFIRGRTILDPMMAAAETLHRDRDALTSRNE